MAELLSCLGDVRRVIVTSRPPPPPGRALQWVYKESASEASPHISFFPLTTLTPYRSLSQISSFMSTQNFIGTNSVDQFTSGATARIPDSELNKHEAQRDPTQESGANKRAGVASRDPAGMSLMHPRPCPWLSTASEFDTVGRSGGPHGDMKPTAGG